MTNLATILAPVKKFDARVDAANRALIAVERSGDRILLKALKAIKALPCATLKELDVRERALYRVYDSTIFLNAACRKMADQIDRQNARVEAALLDAEDRKAAKKFGGNGRRPKGSRGR